MFVCIDNCRLLFTARHLMTLVGGCISNLVYTVGWLFTRICISLNPQKSSAVGPRFLLLLGVLRVTISPAANASASLVIRLIPDADFSYYCIKTVTERILYRTDLIHGELLCVNLGHFEFKVNTNRPYLYFRPHGWHMNEFI